MVENSENIKEYKKTTRKIDKVKESNSLYYIKNKNEILKTNKNWVENNKERNSIINKNWYNKKREEDNLFYLRQIYQI